MILPKTVGGEVTVGVTGAMGLGRGVLGVIVGHVVPGVLLGEGTGEGDGFTEGVGDGFNHGYGLTGWPHGFSGGVGEGVLVGVGDAEAVGLGDALALSGEGGRTFVRALPFGVGAHALIALTTRRSPIDLKPK